MADDHDVETAVDPQYSTEAIPYTLDVTNVGRTTTGTVASPTMTVYALSDWSDKTSAVTTGSMSVSGQVITLKKLQTLSPGEKYRIDVGFTKDGGTHERRIRIDCPRND